ncbi:MAG: hypothetical protein U0K19_03515 [Bifidobacteriaceae bacterium]|nr:hypothetical protein [Bifidobacteriaceae bacterium]
MWDIASTISTIAATIIALVMGVYAIKRDSTETARFVSCWVTTRYSPNEEGTQYNKSTTVYIANNGNEPVFQADLNISIGSWKRIPLGPLAAELPISVIPPQTTLPYDITIPLLGYDDPSDPRASLIFTDANGKHWIRKENGELQNITKSKSKFTPFVEEDQLADLTIRLPERKTKDLNPLQIALKFMLAIKDADENGNYDNILQYTSPIFKDNTSEEDLTFICNEYCNYNVVSNINYPTPFVAYAKIIEDPALANTVATGPMTAEATILTLSLTPQEGWRIVGIGYPIDPSRIVFPPHTL